MKKKILIICLITIALLVLIEITSMLILKFNNKFVNDEPIFNRKISCFYVYKNTPGFKHQTIKSNNNEKDVIIDEYGFICNEEIKKLKPNNCLRIFITGGSAAFGSGQARPYNEIIKYQTGIYSYESSIAGILKSILQNKYPEKKIEVINACSSGRKINQNITQYLAVIKDFSPDIIISMDGMNDLITINGSSPFDYDEQYSLDKYLNLHEIEKSLTQNCFPYTLQLIKKIKFKVNKKHVANNEESLLDYNPKDYNLELYISKKTELINSCSTFTDLILYYNALCKTDSVDFIFCIQPLLQREINKELSSFENKMQQEVKPINISLSQPNLNKKLLDEYESIGIITLKYFFDDYLSDTIKLLSKKHNFNYIDLNKEITHINKNIEFYTDYCHLSFEANKIIAELFFREIEIILKENLVIEEDL